MTGQKMTNKEYREHEGVSKSALSKIMKSPLHFKYYIENPQEDTPALLFGRALHKYILEKDDFYNEFAVAPIVDRRTKDGKEIYKSFEEASAGKDIISSDDFEKIKDMSDAAFNNPFVKKLLDGEHEMSFFWTDSATGEKCKCRPDCLTKVGEQNIIVDYKTCDNAETESFIKSAIVYAYDLQAGMYSEGMKKNTGNDYIFVFIAQEKKPPYAINILQANEMMMKEGTQLFHDLLEILHECHVKDEYPGYMGFENEISSLGVPKWLESSIEV